jgi:hypothetical protein
MAIHYHARRRGFNHTRRSGRTSIDDMVRSTDVTLHVAIIVMLLAFVFGGWYLYERATPTVDNTNGSASTINAPPISPSSPNANPSHPGPPSNPGP